MTVRWPLDWTTHLPRNPLAGALLLLAGAAMPTTASRAQGSSMRDVVPGWIGLIAAPGREGAATSAITAASPGWQRGPLGSLIRRAGHGAPRRVIACSLDRAAYSVSEITRDGYLRVHNAEPGARHVLWDQMHEGQRVLVQTTAGTRAGVFAVRSTHLWRRRAQQEAVGTVEDLWLDVGARSAAEVSSLGIAILDPVVRELPAWRYGQGIDEMIAGSGAAQRMGCAAVAAMATVAPSRGENTYVIATQTSFGGAGFTAALLREGPVQELVLAAPEAASISDASDVAVVTHSGHDVRNRLLAMQSANDQTLAVRARFGGTLMESIRTADVEAFVAELAKAADVPLGSVRPVRLAPPPAAPTVESRHDEQSGIATLLGRLTDVYGVSGHESFVRDAVLAELPAWARALARVDTAGNLVLALGPDRDTSVVIAHTDEIGFEITRIAHDGTVSLATRGSFYPSLWEGQPALLHVAGTGPLPRHDEACGAASGGPLRGVFVPRDSAARRQPPALTAWFGMDSAALVARGVGLRSPLTAYKCATRLAGPRLAARSIDDRAGCAALILAVRELDRAALRRKVIFVWSVREETGLDGAAAAAATFGPSVHRVHSVDTFVTADSPLESTRFALAPMGAGAVVRALDNSSVTVPAETARLVALARARGIALQVGVTNGGNDASEFARWGGLAAPLAWPLRYSHSPAEVIDLRDLRSLADIVKAAVTAP